MTTITERPHNFSFSENEIRYVFNTDDPGAAGCEVETEIHYLSSDLLIDIRMITLSLIPAADGSIYFQIHNYLKSLLTPQLPDPAGDVLQPVTDQFRLYYIRYREKTIAQADPAWTDDVDNKKTALLGGVEQMKFRRNNFFANYLNDTKSFLTWQPGGKRIFTDQEHYLTFLIGANVTVFTVKVQTIFTDLTTIGITYLQSVTAAMSRIWRFRSGLEALGLQLLSPTKKIYYYEVSVTSGTDTIAAPYRFYVDYNRFYDFHDFHYFNSLGGIDTARLQGQFNRNVNIAADDLEHITNNESFTSSFPKSQYSQANALKRDSYKGDIGWSRSQLQQEVLIELLVSKGIFEIIGGRWIRVINLGKSQDLGNNNEKKWSFPLEWNYGYTDAVFTPKNVLLGAGAPYVPPVVAPPAPPPCVAVMIPESTLPDGRQGTAYNYWIDLSGDAPFTINITAKPSGMYIGLSERRIIFSGTPDTAGTNQLVAFSVNNCNDSHTASFNDGVNIAPTATQQQPSGFGTVTFVSGDASTDTERVAINGVAGSNVTIKLTTYTNNNGGQLNAQGGQAYLNYTWVVTLNSSGEGSFSAQIIGNASNSNSNSIIRGVFTITAVSSGSMPSNTTYQISKVF